MTPQQQLLLVVIPIGLIGIAVLLAIWSAKSARKSEESIASETIEEEWNLIGRELKEAGFELWRIRHAFEGLASKRIFENERRDKIAYQDGDAFVLNDNSRIEFEIRNERTFAGRLVENSTPSVIFQRGSDTLVEAYVDGFRSDSFYFDGGPILLTWKSHIFKIIGGQIFENDDLIAAFRRPHRNSLKILIAIHSNFSADFKIILMSLTDAASLFFPPPDQNG